MCCTSGTGRKCCREKLMMTVLPFLLGGFFRYTGRKPASKSEKIRVKTFKMAVSSRAEAGRLETVKLVLGTFLVFRSDLHIYNLSTRTLNPQLQWDIELPVIASSFSVQFPVVNAARSLVSIPVKPCQLSFLRSLCCLKITPTSVFAKLVHKEPFLRNC